MVLKKLKRRIKAAKAKSLGMTVEEYKKAKVELRKKEGQERLKHEKWKIEHKYKQKRKAVKSGRKRSFSATLNQIQKNLETLGGPGLFSQSATRKRKKKSKKRRKKR